MGVKHNSVETRFSLITIHLKHDAVKATADLKQNSTKAPTDLPHNLAKTMADLKYSSAEAPTQLETKLS